VSDILHKIHLALGSVNRIEELRYVANNWQKLGATDGNCHMTCCHVTKNATVCKVTSH